MSALVGDVMNAGVEMNWLLYRYALIRPNVADPETRQRLAEYWNGVYEGKTRTRRRPTPTKAPPARASRGARRPTSDHPPVGSRPGSSRRRGPGRRKSSSGAT